MSIWFLFGLCILYLLFLFGVAYYAEKKSVLGKSLINNPIIYALSLTTYCTAWTFYGSVGKAATTGIGFLPTYLGPIILAGFWYILFRWVIRICKIQRITSIADFIASRYGSSTLIGVLVSSLCILAIVPYISLQLKAISQSFNILYSNINSSESIIQTNTGLLTAILMSLFIIIFGTRKIDASERQEGMVFAIAFEAMFKLVAFLAIGIYVTFFIFDGFGDIFRQANEALILNKLTSVAESSVGGYWDWFMLINLSFMCFMLLPRQFYLIGVQNTDEEHSSSAGWLFSVYLLLINIFIIPIALGGLIIFQGHNINADTFVLMLPIANDNYFLSIIVFFGGFAAATGMIIVSAYAISMMLTNNILLPLFLKFVKEDKAFDYPKMILILRRISIIVIMVMSYVFLVSIGKRYPLVEMGLISFVGIAQLAPSFFGAIFWKKGNRNGVTTGLVLGTVIWIFTLVLPTMIRANLFLDIDILSEGIFGLGIFRPYALFGFMGMNNIVHGMFWSLLANMVSYLIISHVTNPSLEELEKSNEFSAIGNNLVSDRNYFSKSLNAVPFIKIKQLLVKFFGMTEANKLIEQYQDDYKVSFKSYDKVTLSFVDYTENLLTGVVGSATSRILISKIVKRKNLDDIDLIKAVSETRDIINHSKELETKSKELEVTSAQLQHVNERLKEMDKLKDSFIASISHELRTPLTSIRTFAEMLSNKEYDLKDKQEDFLNIIVKESVRLSSLINDILYFERLVQKKDDLVFAECDLSSIAREVLKTLMPQAQAAQVFLDLKVNNQTSLLTNIDEHKIKQVFINLISNAIKFSDQNKTHKYVRIDLHSGIDAFEIVVTDNGIGISESELENIFDEFYQVGIAKKNKTYGFGLGLAIVKKIILLHQGTIKATSKINQWTEFTITIPK